MESELSASKQTREIVGQTEHRVRKGWRILAGLIAVGSIASLCSFVALTPATVGDVWVVLVCAWGVLLFGFVALHGRAPRWMT